MTELEIARSGINEIDEKMAELFEKRMNLVVQVANYKQKNGMQVFDSSREKQVIDRCVQYIKNIDLEIPKILNGLLFIKYKSSTLNLIFAVFSKHFTIDKYTIR